MIARSAGHHDRPVATTGGPRPGTTLGYGDILPRSDFAKMLVMSQVLLAIFLLGFYVSTMITRLIESANR